MTAHELARILLAGPDVEVWVETEGGCEPAAGTSTDQPWAGVRILGEYA